MDGRDYGVSGQTKLPTSLYVISSQSDSFFHACQPSYSLLMPTLRGFGPSTHPKDVQTAGAIHDHTRDLFCIMRTAQVSKVVCVGHDWGAQVCWEAARARPDLVEAVAGVVVPVCLPSPCHE